MLCDGDLPAMLAVADLPYMTRQLTSQRQGRDLRPKTSAVPGHLGQPPLVGALMTRKLCSGAILIELYRDYKGIRS